MPETQRAEIIQPQNVIGMRVRIQDGVDLTDTFANCLCVEVWSGIDEYHFPGIFDHDRWPRTSVVRVGRMTNCTVAADCGYTHRRPATKDRECCLHFPGAPLPGTGSGARANAFVTST